MKKRFELAFQDRGLKFCEFLYDAYKKSNVEDMGSYKPINVVRYEFIEAHKSVTAERFDMWLKLVERGGKCAQPNYFIEIGYNDGMVSIINLT